MLWPAAWPLAWPCKGHANGTNVSGLQEGSLQPAGNGPKGGAEKPGQQGSVFPEAGQGGCWAKEMGSEVKAEGQQVS